LNDRRIAAIGPASARALEGSGKTPDYVPRQFLSRQIAEGLDNLKGKRLLLPRADIASQELPSILRKKGAMVDEVVAYRTIVPSDLTAEKVRLTFQEGVDMVTFTSPSTIHYLSRVLGGNQLRNMLRRTRVACIGPVTVDAARSLGVTVDVVANTHTVDGLVEAIVNDRSV
jgi:uroporphyrinogen-III synthase